MNETAPPLMTKEEARQVLWLRSMPRPLGQLLDEGYLNRQQLVWASANAYNPKLRQAAKILLETQIEQSNTPVPVGLSAPSSDLNQDTSVEKAEADKTLAQARSVLWPFNPFKNRRMGELVDTEQISLKDLGYAVETAYDSRVKSAAMTLMSHRMKDISHSTLAKGMINVVDSGPSFSARHQFYYAFWIGCACGAFFTAMISIGFFLQHLLRSISSPRPLSEIEFSPVLILAFIISLAIYCGIFWLPGRLFEVFVINWLQKKFENHFMGKKGEERVTSIIQRKLDGNWHLFCNVMVPGFKADVDLVLVGPMGVWAIEVKNYVGNYRHVGDRWEYQKKGTWHKLRNSPSKQAKNAAAHLGNFLKANGINQWVTPVVAWASDEGSLHMESAEVAVWKIEHLADELDNLSNSSLIPEATLQKLIRRSPQTPNALKV
jgi:Nuclease-related domain